MYIPRVSSVPTGLIVAHLSLHASVRSAELCLEDTVANTKGRRKKGGGGQNQKWPRGGPQVRAGGQNYKWPTSGPGGYITPAAWGIPTASRGGGRMGDGPQVGKVAT